VQTAHIELLAIDDVRVTIADRPGLHPSQVGPGVGLAEELPRPPLPSENGWQKLLLLLLRAPHKNTCPAKTTAGIVIWWQVQTIAVELFFENHDKIDAEVSAPICFGICRVEPAFHTKPAAQFTQFLVLFER
jgi:hypothetical protein